MDTSTAKNLRPAYGRLDMAISLMAARYASSRFDAALCIADLNWDGYERADRQGQRRFRALQRLVDALASAPGWGRSAR